MEALKTAPFGVLFAITFTTAATFQFAMAMVGVVIAFAAPSMISLNGAPAAGPGQGLLAILLMLLVFLLFNALVSSAGSALWLGVRKLLFRTPVRSAAA